MEDSRTLLFDQVVHLDYKVPSLKVYHHPYALFFVHLIHIFNHDLRMFSFQTLVCMPPYFSVFLMHINEENTLDNLPYHAPH